MASSKHNNPDTKNSDCTELTKQEEIIARSITRSTSGDLLQRLNAFRKNEQFTDVCLLSSDGTRISAHRNILSAASPFFMAMFCGNFPESDQAEIKLPEIDGNCLQSVVEYIYTGMCDIYDVQQLFQTASFLQMNLLVDVCSDHMSELLDPENCLGFKHFAEKQNNKFLLEMSTDFIISNFQDVVQTEEFDEMSHEELIAILRNNKLFVHSDDTILKGIVRWVECKPDTRSDYLPQLLRFIHPMCVTAQVTRSLKTLTEKEDCQKWLSEVEHYEGSLEWSIFLVDKMGKKPETFRFELDTDKMIPLRKPPRPAFGISLAAHKNILYMQGGSVGYNTKDSYYYNIYRNEWFDLKPLLTPRSHHRTIVYNDCLYTVGGNTHTGITSTVEYLNLATDKAYHCGPMREERSSMGAVRHENMLYVMGGEKKVRSRNSVEGFDPREDNWHILQPLINIRGYCSSAVIGNYIYCCAGLGKCMERYDVRANKWEIINFGEEREFYEIFTVNNQLFSTCGKFIARYDTVENRWVVVYRFPYIRDWDYAVAMQMVSYSTKDFDPYSF